MPEPVGRGDADGRHFWGCTDEYDTLQCLGSTIQRTKWLRTGPITTLNTQHMALYYYYTLLSLPRTSYVRRDPCSLSIAHLSYICPIPPRSTTTYQHEQAITDSYVECLPPRPWLHQPLTAPAPA